MFCLAVRANGVRELRIRSTSNVGRDILPESVVVANIFTIGTNGNHTVQGSYLTGRVFEIETCLDEPSIGCRRQLPFPEIEDSQYGGSQQEDDARLAKPRNERSPNGNQDRRDEHSMYPGSRRQRARACRRRKIRARSSASSPT